MQFVLATGTVDRGMGWEETETKVMVTARPSLELISIREEPYFRYGDALELRGRLEEPPRFEGFDYRAYLSRQGIPLVMRHPEVELLGEGGGNPLLKGVFWVRDRLASALERSLPEPQASLAQALLLGRRGQLPQEITEDFRATGTSHLLAISGLHVGVVMVLLMGFGVWLLGRRGRTYLLLPLVGVWGYALLSGLSPSVERAAIMVSVYLAALALGRPRSVLPALALAAGLMAGLNPLALMDASFQLSFTAVAGIALVMTPSSPWAGWLIDPPRQRNRWWSSVLRGLSLAVVVSLAATLATLPLVAFNFHRIPTLGIPATILSLPALPPMLAASALAAVAELVHPVMGQVAGWVAWVPLWYLVSLVHLFSLVPGSTVSVPAFSGLLVGIYYALFTLILLVPSGFVGLRKIPWRMGDALRGLSSRQRPLTRMGYVAMVVGLGVVVGVIWANVAAAGDGRLHLLVLDVGQGDSILIVTPHGRQMLIDGGPDEVSGVRALGRHLPFWDRSLDVVVLTHPDEDHLAGLPRVLERYRVGTLLESGTRSEITSFALWRKALIKAGLEPVGVQRGQRIVVDRDVWLDVLNPSSLDGGLMTSDLNNNSVVLRLVYGEVSFLLTADIEAEAEREIRRSGALLNSTVLKVPHHGNRSSTTSPFLGAVSPNAAVISVGGNSRFGHPHREVVDRLSEVVGQEQVYITADHGAVEFITDGTRLWVKLER